MEALATYLHDHLAGSHFAIKLLDSLAEQYAGEGLGAFATLMCQEIQADQAVLEQIIEHVGRASLDLTEAIGWLGEKATAFKLSRDADGPGLGTFEALEMLTLGIRGKMALWQVLRAISEFDRRIPAQDFEQLLARAEQQFDQVESKRLELANVVFRPDEG